MQRINLLLIKSLILIVTPLVDAAASNVNARPQPPQEVPRQTGVSNLFVMVQWIPVLPRPDRGFETPNPKRHSGRSLLAVH